MVIIFFLFRIRVKGKIFHILPRKGPYFQEYETPYGIRAPTHVSESSNTTCLPANTSDTFFGVFLHPALHSAFCIITLFIHDQVQYNNILNGGGAGSLEKIVLQDGKFEYIRYL